MVASVDDNKKNPLDNQRRLQNPAKLLTRSFFKKSQWSVTYGRKSIFAKSIILDVQIGSEYACANTKKKIGAIHLFQTIIKSTISADFFLF